MQQKPSTTFEISSSKLASLLEEHSQLSLAYAEVVLGQEEQILYLV